MIKRKYRSTTLQAAVASWPKILENLQHQPVVVSIDVAKTDYYAALMTPDRQVHIILRWQHPAETRQVVDTLHAQLAGREWVVVMEPTGTYGDPLRHLFHTAGIPVYRVSPNRVHQAAEVYDGVPSLHDAKACHVIGRLHLDGNSERWQEMTVARRALKAELRQLAQCQERQQRSLNRLEALLARHWPEATQHLSLDSATLLHLLAQYGAPATIHADVEQARQRMRQIGRSGLKASTCDQLLASAATTLGVPCEDAERQYLQALASDLLALRQAICDWERHLQGRLADDEILSRLRDAVGPVAAVVLMAEVGSPGDYPSAAHYLKALGLNLKERSSGKHKGRLMITKRGPGAARYYLYWAVLRLLKTSRAVQGWSDAKAQRDGGHKGKAIIAVMRKLSRALWHVARGAPFDPDRLFTAPSPSPAKAA